MNTHEIGSCPFKKLNNRIQRKTRDSICDTIKADQITKHKQYVDILRLSFEKNANYYINIQKHVTPEDIKEFKENERNNRGIQFINKKIKEYFWKGIVFHNKENITRESSLERIGNLGLDDVTTILNTLLSQETISLEEVLLHIDTEMSLRLRNNVLIDSIIHLKEFPHPLISKNPEISAQGVGAILENNFMQEKNRFSQNIIPEEFVEPMRIDNMIDETGVIPQLTFGCPVANIDHGKIFKSFIKNIVQCFLITSDRFGSG